MTTTPIIDVRGLSVTYKVSRGPFAAKLPLRAIQDVDIAVHAGETLAIVGESGSGKTTLAMAMLNIQPPTSGEILFKGQPLASVGRRAFARQVQPVFQDPYSSLNPSRAVLDTIIQPLGVHKIGDRAEQRRRAFEMMGLVGLSRRFADAQPDQLSGGQRQRVAIARALVMKPEILICDEPTSALDVLVQAQILSLLDDLRTELSLTYILITHNLAIVEQMASRVVVMYLGRVVEEAPAREFFGHPQHPYSIALLSSALTPDPGLGLPDLGLRNVFPDPLHPPPGCHFHPRCNCTFDPCDHIEPREVTVRGHGVRCHLFDPGTPGDIRGAQWSTASV